jgi:hypothetical protein
MDIIQAFDVKYSISIVPQHANYSLTRLENGMTCAPVRLPSNYIMLSIVLEMMPCLGPEVYRPYLFFC